MRNKKSDEPERLDEEKIIEQRVDQMMASRGEDSLPAVAITVEDEPATTKTEPIPAEQKTAPALPKKLAVSTGDDEVYKPEIPADPPIEIKLADEATDTKATETPAEVSDQYDDQATDTAVDDILAHESDKLLAVDDAVLARKQQPAKVPKRSLKSKLARLLKNKWTWIILAALLLLLLAVPASRYKLLGLVIKKPATITVLDNQTGSAVSNAQIELGGSSAKTDANGRAKLNAAVGPNKLKINKQYYNAYSGSYFVGFKAAKESKIKLTATGRLVPITVINKINGKPLSGVEIKVLKTTAKTNSKGQALVALPTDADTYPGNLKLAGYNSAAAAVQVTDKPVKANSFELTPTGSIYFLSNLHGTLDVVKSNLDGSDRKIVLKGTGREDANTTSLLASRDWRYLVLKARRDGAQPALHLIDTASDKFTQFDNSNADFNLVGWYGHSFIYEMTRPGLSVWQAGRQQLKSYDAEHLQLNQLDQNQAEGAAGKYAYQSLYNFYILNGVVVYNTQWYTFSADGQAYDNAGKNDSIRAVQPNGQNKKDYHSFPAGQTGYTQAVLYEPQGVYYAISNNNDSKIEYLEFENLAVKPFSPEPGAFNKAYPTFLISPNGKQTFWTELRDGKNSLFTGDPAAESKKQIATLSEYAPYGWHSDNYLLLSKNNSELYVMPAGGLAKNRQPIKITDYFKPAQTYTGYGYGYGGL